MTSQVSVDSGIADIHGRTEDFANKIAEMNLLLKNVVHLDRHKHLELKYDNQEEKKKTFNHWLTVATSVCSVSTSALGSIAGVAGASALGSILTGISEGVKGFQKVQEETIHLSRHGHDHVNQLAEVHTQDLRDTIQRANDAKQQALQMGSESRRNLFDLVRSMAN